MCNCSPDLETDSWNPEDDDKWFCFMERGTTNTPMLVCGCTCHIGGVPADEWRTYKVQHQPPHAYLNGNWDNFPAPRWR